VSQPAPTRNDTIEFCRRTRSNFEFIEKTKASDPTAPVYAVTQLTLSLLGIVVFPYERIDHPGILAKTVDEMTVEGWFGWSVTLDSPKKGKSPTSTLGDLLFHLRNAVAHGRLTFSSDSPQITDVVVTAEDQPNAKGAVVNWRAEITGPALKYFCLRFLQFVDGLVG
jgi:hypothetical protein